MITFKFQKPILEVKLVDGSLENVIKTIHWRYIGTSEDGKTADMYGAITLSSPSKKKFVKYNELDNDIIIGWLNSILDVAAMEKNIANQIELIENPVIEIRTIN